MKPFAILLGVTLCLVSSIEASITTNTPFKSVTWNGGDKEKVVWGDDGKSPKLQEIGRVTVDLMVGGDENQVLADNIGKVPATAKEIEYEVPEDVGPPGDFYFIRYTGENGFVAFSGTFSIAKVNGKIKDFDPENPNEPATGTPSPTPSNDPALTTTSTTTQTIPPSNSPKSSDASPQGNNTSSTDNQPKEVPVPISSNSGSGLLPNLFVVSTTITALALKYLHY